MSPFKKMLRDPALWTLLLLNVLFIYQYGNDTVQYTSIVWLYWCQSVLIGIFTFLDMITAGNVKPDITVNGKPASRLQARGCFPVFFLVHYGIFHFAYLFFLLVDFRPIDADFSYLKWGLAAVFVHQLIHFARLKIRSGDGSRSFSSIFFTPYLRIVPMHLTILLPKFLGWTPGITFLILKTIFDMIGYLVTTKYYWNGEERTVPGKGSL